MTNLWLALIVKSTAVLIAATGIAYCLRTHSAAARHLVWVSAMAVLLILPLGVLLPEEAAPVAFRVASAAWQPVTAPVAVARPVWVWAWAAGALALMLRLAVSACRAWRLVRGARAAGRVNGLDIRETTEVRSPLAWTFGSGTIVLPDGSGAWDPAALATVLRHEAAHLARRDGYALLIGELARALYWFHPLAWYALHRLRTEQEHAADDAVLAAGIEPADYAQHLVELARFGRPHPLLAGVASKRTLASRVATILDTRRSRTVQNRRMVLASVAGVVFASVPLSALQTGEKPYSAKDPGVTPPVVLQKQQPKYTQEAKDAKLQGTVLLSAIIEPTGRTSNIRVVEGLGLGLDESAMEAVSNWVFKPAEKDGAPVRVSCNIEINFRLLD